MIRRATAPHFLATKLEAFSDRGHEDFMASHDLEDIVCVVDGRPELPEEVRECANPKMRAYIAERVSRLVGDERFVSALPGHLGGSAAAQARVPVTYERFRAIAEAGAAKP